MVPLPETVTLRFRPQGRFPLLVHNVVDAISRIQLCFATVMVLGVIAVTALRVFVLQLFFLSLVVLVLVITVCICVFSCVGLVFVAVIPQRGAADPEIKVPSPDTSILCIPTVRTHSLGQRSFSNAAPAVWNTLPYEIRSSNTLSSFKSSLKTYLRQLSY